MSKTVTAAVACKNCGGTVMVEKQNVMLLDII